MSEIWRTFPPADPLDPLRGGFHALEGLDEHHLPPGAGLVRRADRDVEVITYVREGTLAYEEAEGSTGLIHTGEVERTSADRGVRRTETNPSRRSSAHVLRIWLCRSIPAQALREQRIWTAAKRRGRLVVVASGGGNADGSMHLAVDAQVFSVVLRPGQHVAHALERGRCAWLHVVQGEIALGDVVLTTGDGAGVTAEHAVSLTARADSEVLLVDLADGPVPSRRSAA